MKWFIKCIRQYVDFNGRARRKEYWFFSLFSLLLMIVAWMLDIALLNGQPPYYFSWFYLCAGLFILLPSLAVLTRRLHDVNRSGWNVVFLYLAYILWIVLLIVFGASFFVAIANGATPSDVPPAFLATIFGGAMIFFVWGIVFLVWMCTKGTPGDNKYGPDPLAEEE